MYNNANANATEIIKGLWIGDAYSSQDTQFFKDYKIGAVINCTPDVPNKFSRYGVNYLRIPIDDSLQKKDIDAMKRALLPAIYFINQHRKNDKNILVHCHAGIQRSADIVVGYLMKVHKFSLVKAIDFVIKQRPQAFFGGKHINFLDSLIALRLLKF